MAARHRPAARHRALRFQLLECRRVLAAFGTPWPDPRSLTVSFPPDDVAIGAYTNVARFGFDQVADRREWQEAVLRAFQTWAVETNLNIGLSTDRGDPFGTIGLAQNDPRFGDFRVGAFPQSGVLANTLPYQTRSGSWAGDVLFNSDTRFFVADREDHVSTVDVPQPNEQGVPVELFSVALHEAGNALGLPDLNQPDAVMHQTYVGPKGQLTPADVDQIRKLYGGLRQDPFEPQSNDSLRSATVITSPDHAGPNPVLTVRGSLNSTSDVDHYRFRPEPGHEKVTVRLRAAGISLVKAHVFVLDANGNIIADAKADSIFGNDLELQIGSLEHHPELFLRVVSNSDDVFGLGDYEIDIDWRPRNEQPDLGPIHFDQGYREAFQSFDDDDEDRDDDDDDDDDREQTVDAIFSRAGLVDPELGANDEVGTATALETPFGYRPGNRFEGLGSIQGNDVDYWTLRSADAPTGPMQIRVDRLGDGLNRFWVDLFDAGGNRVDARVTLDRDGSVTFRVDQPVAAADYYVRVRFAADEPDRAPINYFVKADFATGERTAAELFSGRTEAAVPTWSTLRVAKTQLFRFELEASGNDPDQAVAISLYDPRTATIVFSMSVQAGFRKNAFAWLQRGDYFTRVTSIGRDAAVPRSLDFRLDGIGISDDQGPLPIDPNDPDGSGYASDPYSDPYSEDDPLTSIDAVPNPYPFEPFPTGPSEAESDIYEQPLYDPWYFDPYYDPYYEDPLIYQEDYWVYMEESGVTA